MASDYQYFLTRFKAWLKDVNDHELKGAQNAFRDFQNEVGALGRYSKEQIKDYTYYISRDLEQAKQQWQEKDIDTELAKAEFSEEWWLTLSHLVDKTQLEWSLLQNDFQHNGVYAQGEWVAFGEFKCRKCGESTYVTHPVQLSACSACDAFEFTRLPYAP